jgi:hypothetical protein
MERSRGRSKPARSSSIIERIDQALAELVEIRSNTGLYWRRFCDADSEVGKALLSEAVVDLAAELYSRDARAAVELVEFTDGAFDVLFDLVAERTVLVHGLSRYTSPNSRDVSYHRGFPSVAGYDKGHAMPMPRVDSRAGRTTSRRCRGSTGGCHRSASSGAISRTTWPATRVCSPSFV